MMLLIVTITFLVIYAGLIGYYFYHWKKLPEFEPQANKSPGLFLSVVIAARNEEEALPHLLKTLQQQTYPQSLFEVIVVNDFSTDRTEEVVKSFGAANIKVVQPEGKAATSSKKKAIAQGVQEASGALVVITDADCRPQAEWLQIISAFYVQQEAVFIAAPVKYEYNNSLLQLFQAIDFLVLQGITAASVAAHFHSMCNGANLAYTKKAFVEVDGFSGIDAVASGDDMLLMHKIRQRYPHRVLYLKNEKAIMRTQPMPTWSHLLMQRRRWASKTTHYNDVRILYVLLFVYLFNLLFFVLLTAALFKEEYAWLALFYVLAKLFIEFPFVYAVSKFYKEQKLLCYFPFFQPLHIFYTVIVGLISQWGQYEWKGRKTK